MEYKVDIIDTNGTLVESMTVEAESFDEALKEGVQNPKDYVYTPPDATNLKMYQSPRYIAKVIRLS